MGPSNDSAAHPHDAAYRYCPRCGGALASKRLKPDEPDRLVCATCDFVFYLDPKVAVGTIIRTHDDRIVLVRRAIEPGYGRWVFPGGYVDRGELLHAAALREAREESGLEIAIDGLVNLYSYEGRPTIIVVYAATVVSGELQVNEECLEAAWFEPAIIPWGDLAFRSTRDALRDYLAGMLHWSTLGGP